MARTNGKALELVVRLEVSDGEPGQIVRLASVLAKVAKMMRSGSTAGEFEEEFSYSQGGEANRDYATVTFTAKRVPMSGAND